MKTELEQTWDWVRAAILDGWSVEPTYGGESWRQAATLKKGGFQAQVIMRPKGTKFGRQELLRDDASINVWGPDGMAIRLEGSYDWNVITAALTVCNECAKKGPTVRIGFAGRVCAECRKKLAPSIEYPGWTD